MTNIIRCKLTRFCKILKGRIPVPNNGACDWGLHRANIVASCNVCKIYYDPVNYGNNKNGHCVYVPAKEKCFPAKWARDHGYAISNCGMHQIC